jgi:hypothetical protein
MRNQDSCLRCQRTIHQTVLDDCLPDMSVHSRQGVIEQNDIGIGVSGSGERDAGLGQVIYQQRQDKREGEETF